MRPSVEEVNCSGTSRMLRCPASARALTRWYNSQPMNILVSECLLGIRCKYSGGSNPCPAVIQAVQAGRHTLIPVCPECLGGLAIPRQPSERVGDRVLSRTGEDVTAQYERGAQAALALAKLYGCTAAILKERSPSCGSGTIYDGTFRHRRISGDGLTAALLKANGVQVYNEDTFTALL